LESVKVEVDEPKYNTNHGQHSVENMVQNL